MKNVPPFFVAVVAVALISNVSAQSIGVNIATGTVDTPTNALGSGAVVGFIPQNNWNNVVPIATGDGNATGTLSNLVDDAGAVTTMSVLTAPLPPGPPTFKTYQATAAPYGWSGDELTFHTGMTNAQSQITLSDVPYATYDVYIYMGAGFNGGNTAATISLTSGGGGIVDPSTYYFAAYSGTTYSQVTSTNPLAPSPGNYIVFTNNTATDFMINFEATNTIFDIGVAGIQIVAVPEPASLALIGLGAVFLVARRRRSNR